MTLTTIGLDLAKYVFQVHGVDAEGKVIEKRRLRRSQVIAYFASIPPCLVGLEACATAHFWGRELARLGHEVRLMPPQYVKAYLKRGKNDAADAAAICEAVGRPSMRFVPIKTEEQQAVLVMHRARDLLVRQRTQLINAFRGHAAEFGIIAAQGRWNVTRLLAAIRECRAVPEPARAIVEMLPHNWMRSANGSTRSMPGSLLGTRRTPSVSVWRRSPELALSSALPLPPPLLTQRRFEALASLPRGSASLLDRNPPAASSG